MEKDIIDLNLNGRVFRLKRSTFLRLPNTSLEHGEDIHGEVYMERHADSFDAILWYYTNGELHMPNSICPAVFKKELEFWSVEPNKLSQCCYIKYLSFFEDQKLLKTFQEDEKKSTGMGKSVKTGRSKLGKCPSKVWRILDEPSSSVAAKVQSFLYIGPVYTISTFTSDFIRLKNHTMWILRNRSRNTNGKDGHKGYPINISVYLQVWSGYSFFFSFFKIWYFFNILIKKLLCNIWCQKLQMVAIKKGTEFWFWTFSYVVRT